MNKQRRKELGFLKYKKRIKRYVEGLDSYITRDGRKIRNPKAIDVMNDNGQLCYKTTSTPCSCYMCAYDKYNRAKKKLEDKKLIYEQENLY